MKVFQMTLAGALLFAAIASADADRASCDSTKSLCQHHCRNGGGGGITPSLLWIDMAPIEAVVKNEADLGRYDFDFSDNMFMTFGATGYGGSSCGMKFGGTGSFGLKKFISSQMTVPVRDSLGGIFVENGDTVKTDSVAHLITMIAYGGFTVEKSFEVANCMFGIGGMFGGGALILNKSFKENRKGTSAFSNVPADTSMQDVSSWSAAPLTCFDVHATLSYRLAPGIVVGSEAYVLFFHSSSGFNMNTDSFYTTNPGVRFKLIFGNI